ncbi:MAG: bifunctional phosphopantothenoylcysteine decarboxylase/phosphopantothenate--cysteine ligase CoaBC [Bacteroidetes bacterium]|nr:bifunctional phosphopantothenoylcysteine decarboxylase/phosphopantothenate--cysteine ligase CoaBC [Bacteroidota bacterium]
MLKYNILLKITGSIAAYKSAYLISRLMQDGHNIKVVATDSALQFIGEATLEGLTANPVYTDSFEQGKMMSHINLVKWADLTIVVPATANTINKLAAGIGDSLLTSLFLAHDFCKPYLIAPAMNTAMFNHPSTQSSLTKLVSWGVNVLPTGEGYLACGDYGRGKLLEPERIIEFIYNALKKNNNDKKILITAGGTKENIDGIRSITNISTGKTAAAIAQHFINKNYSVTHLHTPDAALPSGKYEDDQFQDFISLNDRIKELLTSDDFDLVIHNAAVSDYSLSEVETEDKIYAVPIKNKIDSSGDELILRLKKNFKIVERIKTYSRNKKLILVSFKFTNDAASEIQREKVEMLLKNSYSDFVVQNDFSDRIAGSKQTTFNLYDSKSKIDSFASSEELAAQLEQIIFIKDYLEAGK